VQSFSYRLAFAQIYQQSIQLEQVLDRARAVVLTADGKVKFITQSSSKLLIEYFDWESSNELPETLQKWLNYQLSILDDNMEVLPTIFPLQITKENSISIFRLIVRLIPDLATGEILLLLEERPRRSISPTVMQLLGLTKREAEILFLIYQDRSNPEIAKALNCSLATVKKHIEHIYSKLNVQSRTSAVLMALTKLGLLE
jgi:ATP/maltotriose-dependent transcriptional regulator MalT